MTFVCSVGLGFVHGVVLLFMSDDLFLELLGSHLNMLQRRGSIFAPFLSRPMIVQDCLETFPQVVNGKRYITHDRFSDLV